MRELNVVEVERRLGEVFGVPMSLHQSFNPGVLRMVSKCPWCQGELRSTVEMGAWIMECCECGMLVSRVLDTGSF